MNYFSVQEKKREDQGQGSGRHPKRAATKDSEWIAGELGDNFKLGPREQFMLLSQLG